MTVRQRRGVVLVGVAVVGARCSNVVRVVVTSFALGVHHTTIVVVGGLADDVSAGPDVY